MSVEVHAEPPGWVDRLAVQDLIYRYADSVTRADWAQTEAMFAPDAILEIGSPYDIRIEGGQAIRQFLIEGTRGSELLIQTAHSPAIQLVEPDRAHATTTIHELSRGVVAASSNFAEIGAIVNYEQYGIYYDDAAKIDGEWKFTHRLFQVLYQAPNSLNGSVIAPRSSLVRQRDVSRQT